MFEKIRYKNGRAYFEALAKRHTIEEAIYFARVYCITHIDRYPMFCIEVWDAVEKCVAEYAAIYGDTTAERLFALGIA